MNDRSIIFENVSKFYGEVLGVNRVSLTIPPGITTLVGPNGSGKTTLMNLMTGLVQPSSGSISVLGLSPGDATEFFRATSAIALSSISFRAASPAGNLSIDSLMLHGIATRWPSGSPGGPRTRATRRRGAAKDRRLQQGHAPEDPARAGDRPPSHGCWSSMSR